MISSKGIKVLCYIAMGFAVLGSIALLVRGINGLIEKNTGSIIWIVLAGVLPIIVTVSLYPIFALANIDENIAHLNQKVDRLLAKKEVQKETTKESATQVVPRIVEHPASSIGTQQNSAKLKSHSGEEAITYINTKYGTHISIEDDCSTIKSKIEEIDQGGFSVIILKKRVTEATTLDEIINVLVMHMVANS